MKKYGQKKFYTNLILFFVLALSLITFFIINHAQAAAVNCYWVGDTSPANWDDSTHWSSSAGGAGGTCGGIGGVPDIDDTAFFTSDNTNNADIDTAVSINALTIEAGYTGTIAITAGNSLTTASTFTINDGTFTTADQSVTVRNLTVSGGTFNGGASSVIINRIFTLTNGTFNAGATTTVGDDFIHTAATGTYNAGATTIFNGGVYGSLYDVNSSETFDDVEFYHSHNYGITLASGDTMVVSGDLTLTDGYLGGGIIDARGDISQGASFVGGTTYLDFGDNAVAQTLDLSGGSGLQLRFDNAADVNDEVVFSNDADLDSITITASFGNGNTVPMTYNGHALTLSNTSAFTQDSGIFNAPTTMTTTGNFILTDGIFNAGTTITHGRNFTHTAATGTYNEGATTIFATRTLGSFDVNSSETFNDVEIYTTNSDYGLYIPVGDTMIVLGDLTLTKGYLENGVIDVRGDITQAGTYGGNYRNNAIIDFGDNGVAQTYTINGGVGPSIRFDNAADVNDAVINSSGADTTLTGGIRITSGFGNANTVPMTYNGHNLATGVFTQDSGTFNSPATSMSAGTFTLTDGVFNAAATTTHTDYFTHTAATGTYNEGATTIFASSRNWTVYDFNVSESFNDVQINTNAGCAFAITNGDSLIVNGDLTLTNGDYKGSTGYIDVKGDTTVDSTFDADAGLIHFSGNGDQDYTINGPQPTGVLTFAKPSGNMTIINSTTIAKTLTLSSDAQQSGSLTINTTNTGGLTLAGATNNPNVTLTGGLSFGKTSTGVPALTMGSGTWSIGDNVDLTDGTFTHNSGTVVLNGSGAQSLTSASQSLNDLTITNASAAGVTFADSATVSGTFTDITPSSKLYFHQGSTFAFADININGGAVGTKIIMHSDSDGNQWLFNVAAVAPTVSYVDAKDSNANGGSEINTSFSINNGNNENWDFPPDLLDHFTLTAYSNSVTAGDDLAIGPTVTVIDINGNTKTDYAGEVWFTSTDGAANLTYNAGAHYTFVGGDNGVKAFNGSDIVLKTSGIQTITLNNSDGAGNVTSNNITVSVGALDHITLTPLTATINSGATYLFSATPHDQYDNLRSDVIVWSVVNGGGTIDQNGLFTAGSTGGTFTDTTKATVGATSSVASVTVVAPIPMPDKPSSRNRFASESQKTPILPTNAARATDIKKKDITLLDFSFFAILDSGNIPLDVNAKNNIKVIKGTNVLVEIPADLFTKQVNVITISIGGSVDLMNLLPDENKYQAVIPMAAIKGDFELTMLVVYEDGSVKEIKKTITVDPQGYIYTLSSSYFGLGRKQEVRVSDAKVTLYKKDKSGKYEVWDFENKQPNPAITNSSGEYTFYAPNGNYYLQAEKAGYKTIKTDNFKVDNLLIARNIQVELTIKPWWWLILILIVVTTTFYFVTKRKRKELAS